MPVRSKKSSTKARTAKKTNRTRGLSSKQAILQAQKGLQLSNITDPPRKLVVLLSGHKEKVVNNNLSTFKNEGLADYLPRSETVTITEAGMGAAGIVQPYTSEDILDAHRAYLTGSEGRVFDVLSDGWVHTIQEVRAAALLKHVTDKTLNNYLGGLSGLGFMEKNVNGNPEKVQLADSVFPLGRPTANAKDSNAADMQPIKMEEDEEAEEADSLWLLEYQGKTLELPGESWTWSAEDEQYIKDCPPAEEKLSSMGPELVASVGNIPLVGDTFSMEPESVASIGDIPPVPEDTSSMEPEMVTSVGV